MFVSGPPSACCRLTGGPLALLSAARRAGLRRGKARLPDFLTIAFRALGAGAKGPTGAERGGYCAGVMLQLPSALTSQRHGPRPKRTTEMPLNGPISF